jgi:exonuclease VII small subunit
LTKVVNILLNLIMNSNFTIDSDQSQTTPKTLEDKINRLKQIQEMLETGNKNISQMVESLKEAVTLKKEIEEELEQIENQLIQINSKNLNN